MISFFSKHRKSIFVGTVLTFLVGIFVGLGGYLFSGNKDREAVAVVGKVSIPYKIFFLQYNRFMERMREQGMDQAIGDRVKQKMMSDMITEEILAQQAEKIGLEVTDFEVAATIQNTPQFQNNGAFDTMMYYQALRQQFHMMPQEYEAMLKRNLLSTKFRQFMSSSIKFTPKDVKEAYLEKKRNMKNFEKEKDAFLQEMSQEEFVNKANYMLKQIGPQIEIKTYLEQREKGV